MWLIMSATLDGQTRIAVNATGAALENRDRTTAATTSTLFSTAKTAYAGCNYAQMAPASTQLIAKQQPPTFTHLHRQRTRPSNRRVPLSSNEAFGRFRSCFYSCPQPAHRIDATLPVGVGGRVAIPRIRGGSRGGESPPSAVRERRTAPGCCS